MDHQHVQPVQSLTPEGRSRRRTLATVALPVVLLLGVVLTGVLGKTPPAPEPPPIADVRTPRPETTPVVAEPTIEPDIVPVSTGTFPRRTIGLAVHSVDETLELFERGELGDSIVAVGGWLSIPSLLDCAGSADRAAAGGWDLLCQRGTVLADEPTPLFTVDQGGIRPLELPTRRIEPQAVPGVELASIVERQFQGTEGPLRPRRVVLAGRFGDPRLVECSASTSLDTCRSAFAIERVIWLDGEPQVRRSQRSPSLGQVELSRLVRWPILDSATERGSIVLSEMLLPRSELATFDPVADRAVPSDVRGPVWYIRTLLRRQHYGDATGRVGWAVIEDATASVLAAEPDGRTASAE